MPVTLRIGDPLKLAGVRSWILQLALALIIFFGFLRPFVIEAFRIPTPSMEATLIVGDHLLVLKASKGQMIPWTDRMRPPLGAFRSGTAGLLMPATGTTEVGEVLVFRYPVGPGNDFIKRAVALGGDTVWVRRDTLYVNGEPSEEWATAFQDPLSQSPLDESWPECVDSDVDGYLVNSAGDYILVPDLACEHILANTAHTRDGIQSYVVPPGHVFMMGDNRDHSSDSRVWGALPEELIKGEALVTYWSWVPGEGFPKLERMARLVR